MVLSDILQLAQSPEYSSHPKQQPEELVGFRVPQWMIEKMKAYIETAKTNPDTTDEELLRMAEEYADMEADTEGKQKKVKTVNIYRSLSLRAVLSSRQLSGAQSRTSAWTGGRTP